MPVFYFLVFLLAIFLWFTLSFLYKPTGRFFYRLWSDAKEAIDEKENNIKGENNK